MEYTPITEDKKETFVTWLTNMSKDLERLPEQPPTHNIFPGSTDGDVITIKDMVGNFIATLTCNNFIIPMLLFMVMIFGSCTQRPQYSSQPFYNEQGQQVMYVDRGDGTLNKTISANTYSSPSRSTNSYSSPSRSSNNYSSPSSSYSSPSRSSYSSPSRSSSNYSSPSRSSSSYSSPSRSSYSSPSRSSSSYSSSSSSYSSSSSRSSYSSPSRR